MTDEWEDIAYGPSISSGGSDDGWEDIAIGAPLPTQRQQLETEAPWYTQYASGAMSGLSGLLDLGQTAASYLPGMSGLRAEQDSNAMATEAIKAEMLKRGVSPDTLKTPEAQAMIAKQLGPDSLGDLLRGGLDAASGVEGSTEVGKGGYAHKLGEYLPGVAMGGGSIVSGGLKGTAGSIAKLLGLDAYLGTAGFGGHEIGKQIGGEKGGLIGELLTTVGAASAPMAVKKLYNSLVDVPTESQALLKAFQVPSSQVSKLEPALGSLKAQGIITPPKSATPFQDINSNLAVAVEDSQKAIGEALDGTATTIADIWPESSLFSGKLKSGADTTAAAKALRTEQDNLTKLGLLKMKPAPEGVDPLLHADDLLAKYKSLERAATKSDKAALRLKEVDEAIDATEISGNELWQLRQSYDKSATWNKIEPAGKAEAYRGMRDAAQNKVLELGGEGTKGLFSNFESQMKAMKRIEFMAGAEKAGKTQAPGKIQTLLGNTGKQLLNKYLGIGHAPAVKPETALKQAFGKGGAKKIGNEIERIANQASISGVTNSLNQLPQDILLDQGQSKENKSSFNSTLDKALTQAEKKIAMDTPKPVEIIEAKRTSSKVPSDSFIEKEEGGQQLKAYPPPAKGSGITVGTGVDLGQHSEKDLEEMGVSDKTIYKVRKYLGKKDAIARAALKEKPLELTKEEADELDAAVHGDIYGTIEDKLKAKGVTLAKLPEEAQTVIKSIAINFGKNFDEKIPSIWKAITEKDWSKVQDLLVNTKWKQPELVARRKREADLLSRIV